MTYKEFMDWAYAPGSWEDRIERACKEHSPVLAAAISLEKATRSASNKEAAMAIDMAKALCNASWSSTDVDNTLEDLVYYSVYLNSILLPSVDNTPRVENDTTSCSWLKLSDDVKERLYKTLDFIFQNLGDNRFLCTEDNGHVHLLLVPESRNGALITGATIYGKVFELRVCNLSDNDIELFITVVKHIVSNTVALDPLPYYYKPVISHLDLSWFNRCSKAYAANILCNWDLVVGSIGPVERWNNVYNALRNEQVSRANR